MTWLRNWIFGWEYSTNELVILEEIERLKQRVDKVEQYIDKRKKPKSASVRSRRRASDS